MMKLGPLLLPYTVLLVVLVMALSFAIARYFDRRSGYKIEPAVTRMLILAVVVARLVFVWRYRSLYGNSPLTIFDIRDGGWDGEAGVIAAWVVALTLLYRRPEIRKALLWTVGVASLAWVSGSLLLIAHTSAQGSMPTSVLQDLRGQPVALSAFRGKPTVVNFWATWCPPCQKEMPAMAQVQMLRPDVNVVFVNQGEAAQTVQQFLAVGRLDLKNVLLDRKQEIARDFDVIGYPTTLLFDASGKLVQQHTGPLSEASLTQLLETTQPGRSLVK